MNPFDCFECFHNTAIEQELERTRNVLAQVQCLLADEQKRVRFLEDHIRILVMGSKLKPKSLKRREKDKQSKRDLAMQIAEQLFHEDRFRAAVESRICDNGAKRRVPQRAVLFL